MSQCREKVPTQSPQIRTHFCALATDVHLTSFEKTILFVQEADIRKLAMLCDLRRANSQPSGGLCQTADGRMALHESERDHRNLTSWDNPHTYYANEAHCHRFHAFPLMPILPPRQSYERARKHVIVAMMSKENSRSNAVAGPSACRRRSNGSQRSVVKESLNLAPAIRRHYAEKHPLFNVFIL